MKRGLVWILALALVLALAGCGAAGGETAASDSAAMEESVADSGGGMNGSMAPMEAGEARESGGAEDRVRNAKLIYTADVTAQTTAFDQCAAELETAVEAMDGYFQQADLYNGSSGYRSASYIIRVPAERFQTLLTRVGDLSHVVHQSKSSEDISEQYYDTESRLLTQRTKLERLQALLARAETMEDIITIESAISDTELAIERLTGTLRGYDALVDYSTVYLSLEEVYQLSDTQEPAQGFAGRMGTAFRSGWNGFVDVLEGLAVLLAYLWVPAAVLAVGGGAAWRVIRRRRARKQSGQTEEKQ